MDKMSRREFIKKAAVAGAAVMTASSEIIRERESGSEIAEFNEMVLSFEHTHSLLALNSITDLTPREAPMHPIREPARIALIPIVSKLNKIKGTNISRAHFEALRAKYMRLSRAVGMIAGNKVDHNR